MHATLNRVFKVIWCKVRLAWVAVSEVASGCGKVQSSTRRSNREVADAAPAQARGLQALQDAVRAQLVPLRQRVQHLLAQTPSTQDGWGLAFTALALASGAAMAARPAPAQLPTNGQVAAGLASIVQNANTLTVNQASQRAIINWDTFNLGRQATVNFVQPSQSSVALNRVLQSDPSQIYGQINANGQVYLVNPAGVYFAPGASVNVGGIVATTHQMADAEFMAGGSSFNRNGATGSVVNEGSIRASLGGYIAMLAPEVRNSGVLVAQSGTVALAAGERITLNFSAGAAGQSQLDSLTVTPAQMDTLVENRQAVRAPGGLIILSAQAASQLAASVVNSGTLEAQGVSQVGGRIVLDAGTGSGTSAGAGGSILHSGRISADSDSAQGGQVTLTGDSIRLATGSSISASGATGGGTVLVGGDWQGSGPLRQASTVALEQGASIDASATVQGNGGKVVLWSNVALPGSLTQVDGSLRAVGAGTQAGVGGQIETSGHLLGIGPNASVVAGAQGQWLIDPADVTISNGAESNISSLFQATPTPWSGASTAVINVGNLVSTLNYGTNVTVTTINSGTAGSGSGDITVSNAISWTGTGSLTLSANRNIALNANIVASGQGAGFTAKANGSISAGAANLLFQTNNGSLVFWSNANGGSAGGIVMNQAGLTFNTANGSTSQTTGGGTIIFAGGTTVDANGNPNGAVVRADHAILFNPQSTGNDITTLYSGGGNIRLNAISTNGYGMIFSRSTSINAGSGTLDIRANATSVGMEFNAYGGATYGTNITAAGININGVSNGSAGVYLLNNAGSFTATGAGDLTITGTTTIAHIGIRLGNSASNNINLTSASGNISLTGTSGSSGTGVEYWAGNVQSTGGGSITVTANSSAWAGYYQPSTVNYTTTTGNITLIGNGAGGYHGMQMGGGNITTTTGHVLLQGRQVGSERGITFATNQTNITTAGGSVTLNGTSVSSLGIYNNVVVNITTVGGNVSLLGASTSFAGIQTDAALNINTSQGAGSIVLNGTSANYLGIYVNDVNAVTLTLKSASGGINVTGSAGDDNQGLYIYKGNISSTTGAIALSGTSGTATGLEVGTLASNITSSSGNITLTGRTGSGTWGTLIAGTEISSAGNISFVSDQGMRINANVYSKGAGNALVFKSNGAIWNSQTQTIQTNNGSLVFWANANGSTTAGRVIFENEVVTLNTANGSTVQTTGGGKLIIGGGTATDASGYPTGAAQWSADWAVSFGGGSSGYGVVHTGGGDISIRGNAAGGSGILIDRTTTINAGNGNITMVGGGSSTGSAIYLNTYNGAYNITAGGDITLQGIGGAYGIRSYFDNDNQGGTIRSTGGNVTLTGNGTTEGVYFLSNNTVVADVGNIAVTGNSATRGIAFYGRLLAGAGNITLSSPLSKIWLNAIVGQLAGSVVTSSSANISVSATSLFDGQSPTFNTAGNVTLTSTDWNLGTVNIGTTANISVLPLTGAGFSSALYLSNLQVNPTLNSVSYTPQSLTIGNATSTSTSTVYLNSVATVAGNISVYGGGVQVSQNLTSNTGNIWLQGTSGGMDVTTSFTTGEKIWAKANGASATLRSARSVLLSGGEISAGTTVLWSGYNNTSTYGVDMGGTILEGGNTWIGGSSSSNGSLRWHGVMVGDGPVSGATPVRVTGITPGLGSVNGDLLIWAGNGATRNGIYVDSSYSFYFTGSVTLLMPAVTVTTSTANVLMRVDASTFNWAPSSGTFGNAVWNGSNTGDSFASFAPSGIFSGIKLDLNEWGSATPRLTSMTLGRYAGMSHANGTAYVLGNSGDLSYNTSMSGSGYRGNLSLYASNLTINVPLAQAASSTVLLSGNTTLSAQSVTAGSLVLQDGSFNLSNVSNSVGTLAASNVTSLSYVNNGTLTLGSAGGVDGITSSGAVAISTRTGNLAITQTVNSSSTGTSAIVLIAGATDAVNVITGGNITVSGSGALDTPGRALLYTGGVTGSTGLTDLIGSGSGNFRYNSTAASTGYTLALGSTGDYAIYRQKPVLTITADTQNKVYGQFTGATTSTTGVNGDTLSQIFGSTLPTTVISGASYSTSGNLKYRATAYAVTVSGVATNQLGYANATYSNGTITITQAPLTVTGALVADKVYNGNASAVSSISGGALSGIRVNGSSNVSDVLTLALSSATFSSKNVGSNLTVSPTYTVAGTDVANYLLTQPTLSGNITQAIVTLSATQLYSGSTALSNVSIGTGVSGETLTYSAATANSSHVGAGNFINAITLGNEAGANATVGGLASNYQLPTLNATLAPVTLTAVNITLTATGNISRAYNGTTNMTIASGNYTVSGLLAGDSLSVANLSAAQYNNAHVASASNVTANNLTILGITSATLGSLSSDYSLQTSSLVWGTGGQSGTNANITPALVSLTATGNFTKVYNGSTSVAVSSANYTVAGVVSGDSLTLSNLSTAVYNSAHVVGANSVTASNITLTAVSGNRSSALGDYSLQASSLVWGTGGQSGTYANITPVALTVTGTLVASKTYDGTTTAALSNGTLVGVLAGDVLALTQAGNFSSANAANGSSVTASDSVAVSSSNRSSVASDYILTQPGGLTGNITKRTVTLSATKTYSANTSLNGNVTIGNLVGTQTLNYGGATANSSQVASNGTNYITAITLANGLNGGLASNYQLPTLNVANAPVTINKAPLGFAASATYKGSTAFSGLTTGLTVNGLMAGETFTSATLTVANASVSANGANYIQTLFLIGGTANMSNYALNSGYNAMMGTTLNTFTVSKAPLGISASGVYSGSTVVSPTSFTLTGLVNSETVSNITSLTVSNASVATASKRVTAIVVGNGTANMGNYVLGGSYNATPGTTTTNAFTMSKAPLTVTADNAAVFVSQSVPGSYNISYSGFVGGQTAGTAGLTVGSVSNTASNGSQAGAYVLTPSGWSAANYNITHVAGNFTIVPANQLLVQVGSTNTTYGADISYASPTVQYMAGNATLVTLTQTQQSGNTFTFADGSSGTVTFTLGAANASLSTANKLVAGSYQVTGSNFSKTSGNFNGNITYSGSSTVNALGLTVNTGNVSKVYDGSDAMTGLTIGLSTVVQGDVVTVSGSGSFSQAGAGSNLSYNVNGLTLGGTDAGNYFLSGGDSFSGSNGVIHRAPLTVTANSTSTQYGLGTTLGTTAFVSTGLVNGETMDSVTLASAGAAATANAGSHNITVASATGGTFDINNYNISYVNGTLTVTAAPLTVTANNQSRSYGAANPAAGSVTLTNGTLYNGDSLGNASLSSTASNTSAVGNYTLTASGQTFSAGSAGNYNITYVDGTLGVTPASLTVTANSTSTQYGLGTTLGGTAFSSSGLQNGETIGTVTLVSTGSAATANVGSYNTTVASATGGTFDINNYNVSYVNGTLSVTAAPLTLTANNQSRSYGAANPLSGGVTVTGGQLYNSDMLGTASLSSTASNTSAVGNYTLTASSQTFSAGSASNYNISYVDGTLGVSPVSLTVTANSTSTQYGLGTTLGGAAFTTSGLQNGETIGSVTLASIGSAATANVGSYSITAGSATAGSFTASNYNISYVNGTLTVTAAPLTVTANNQSRTYGAANPLSGGVTVTGGQLYNSDTLGTASLSSTASNTSAVGNYTLTASSQTFSAGSASNYNISYVDGTLGVTPASLTVTANSTSTQYGLGTTLGGTAFSSSGLQNGETVGSVMLTSTGSAATANVGSYNTTVASATGGTFDINNYNVSYVNGTLTVTAAPLTVTANNQSRSYGAANPLSGGVTVTGGQLYNSDTLGTASLSSTPSNTSAVGNYTLTASGQTFSAGSAGNYNITYVDGTLGVSPASLTVTANSASKTYGQTLAFAGTEFTSVGLVNGETLSAVALASAGAAATAPVNGGTAYAISAANASGANGFVASNYNISYTSGSLTVNPAPLGISASGVYSGTTLVAPTAYTVTGLVNGETVQDVASVTINNANVANANRVTAIQVANGTANMDNYVLNASPNTTANTTTTNTFSLARAGLTVQADNAAMFIGETLPGSHSVSYRGFVNGETANTASGLSAGSVGNSANVNSGAGSYTLTPSGWSADNYSLSYANGSFSIVAANQLLIQTGALTGTYGTAATLAPVSVQYKSGSAGPVVNLTLASSQGNTFAYNDGLGGSVTFTLSPANAALSGSGNLKADSYQLAGTVSNVTGGNFNGTAVYTGSLAVAPLSVQASTGQVSKVYDGSTSMGGLALGLNPVAFSGDGVGVTGSGAFATRNVGSNLSYSVTGLALTGADASNYVLSAGSNSLSGNNGQIVAKTVTLTPQATTKTYDGSSNASANLSGFSNQLGVAGDSVTALTVTFDDKNVGSGKTLTPSGAVISDGNGGNNYNIVYANASTGTVTRLNAVSWVGGATGNWFDPANWAGGAVPDLSNVANVLISSGVTVSFNNTVTPPAQSGPVNIDSLGGATGNLSQTAGTLNVGTGGIALNTLSQSGGTLSSQGAMSLTSFTQSGGSTSVSGTTAVTGNLAMTGGNLSSQGALTAGNLSFSSGVLTAGSDLTVNGSYTQIDGNATVAGNLSVGTFDQGGGSTSVNGSMTTANFTQSGGSTDVTGTLAATQYTQTNGSTTAGNLSAGNLSQTNGTLTVNNNLTVNGTSTQVGGNTTVAGNATTGNTSQAGGSSNVSGNLSTTTYTQSNGTSTAGNLSATTVNVSGGSTNVSGNTTAGNLTLSGGNVTTTGNLTTGNLSQTNGTLAVNNNLTVNGTSTQVGGNTTVAGNVNIGNTSQSGGSSNVSGNLSTTTYTQSNGSSTTGNLSATTVNVSGGSTNVSGNLSATIVNVSGGGTNVSGNLSATTVNVSGGSTSVSGNTTAGNLSVVGGNLLVGGSSTVNNLTMSGGNVSSQGALTVGNLSQSNGALATGGNLNVSGNLSQTGGVSSVSGATHLPNSTAPGNTVAPPEHHSTKVVGGTPLLSPLPKLEEKEGLQLPELEEPVSRESALSGSELKNTAPASGRSVVQEADRVLIVNRPAKAGE